MLKAAGVHFRKISALVTEQKLRAIPVPPVNAAVLRQRLGAAGRQQKAGTTERGGRNRKDQRRKRSVNSTKKEEGTSSLPARLQASPRTGDGLSSSLLSSHYFAKEANSGASESRLVQERHI